MRITQEIRCSALLAGLFLGATVANAGAPGDLDPHFDTDGRVTTDFGGEDYVYSLAQQANGKIVAAGQFSEFNNTTHFGLARYLRNGQLDSSFGGTGRVVTDLARIAVANAVAIQPNGRIIAAGYFEAGEVYEPTASGWALTRYKHNGDLDPSFGHDGIVLTSHRHLGVAYALVIQPDGKILVAGSGTDASTGVEGFAIARYLQNGKLDASFGNHGVVKRQIGGDAYIKSMALQPDGKIVVAGLSGASGQIEVAVARYLTDGTPDATFGTGGLTTTYISNGYAGYHATAVVLQPDGKILVGSQFNGIDSHFGLSRYLTNGTLDATFGSGGVLIADLGGSDHVEGLALQADGKIVAGGWSIDFSTEERHFAVARFLTSGAFDTTFAGAGWTMTAVGAGAFSQANTLLLQQNGKILAGGMARDSTGVADFALVRYLSRTTTSDIAENAASENEGD